jgi:ferredoxin-NADP reductase
MAKVAAEMLVESVTPEAAEVKTLLLRWPEGYQVDVKTGQFVTVFWPDAPAYKRAYSLSSCALDQGFYEVTVKREGKMGTRIVDWAKPGDRLGVLAPAGRFLPVLEPDHHLICIAGGSGVTPFRGFVREATRRGITTRITILYSVRRPADIIFRQEFEELARLNPNFEFHVTCTRLTAEDEWTGRHGRITGHWVRQHLGDPVRTTFYACGPNALVEHAEHLVLDDLMAPKAQLRVEKWG